MRTLGWVLAGVALLVALVPAGGGLLLASMFLQSGAASDRSAGIGIGVASVVWVGLPLLGGWLWLGAGRTVAGAVVLGLAVALSVALVVFLFGAIEAVARP